MAVNVYSNCSNLGTQGTSGTCYLYNNSNLTSPVSNGEYSDGTNCYTVTGGAGLITLVGACPTTYTVSIYARHGSSLSPNAIDIYWSTNDITYTFAATLGVTTSCTSLFASPSIDITPGGTVYFRVQDSNLASDVYFNATNGTGSCPSNSNVYCTYSFTVNSNTSVDITAYNNTMFGDFIYCS
jgi:hypothetical protein